MSMNSECFVSTEFVVENELLLRNTIEKLKIHLADGLVQISIQCVKQACVTFREHAEFLDFHVMKFPKYEAIFEKPWLDGWSPDVDWKKNQLKWKVESRVVEIIELPNPSKSVILSSIFHCGSYVEEISGQRMRKIAQKEPMYIALLRSVESESEDQVVTMNEEQTKTPFPVEVQAILEEYADVFPQNLPVGLPPKRELDHRIELVPGAKPPHRAPYRMSP